MRLNRNACEFPQKYNTESRGEYSQTRRARTASAVYRASSMEILRSLADTAEHRNGVHFVRCVRAALSDGPLDFQPDVVRQQLKALSVVDTVLARQNGYSCRISFHEFIQRSVVPRGGSISGSGSSSSSSCISGSGSGSSSSSSISGSGSSNSSSSSSSSNSSSSKARVVVLF